MDRIDTSARRRTAEAQAAAYLASHDREADEATRRDFEAWLADPYNAVAYARAEAAWEAAGRHLSAELGTAQEAPARPTRRQILAGGAIAASVAGLGLVWLRGATLYATGIGEVRDVRLADGSTMRLNTATHVDVAFDRGRREVALRQGEAFFDVAPDPTRPFAVAAGDAALRAADTAFNVRLRDRLVELTVTRGIVLARATDTVIRRVAAGNGAVIQPRMVALARLDPHLLAQRTAWRERMIELDGDTVAQAVDEFNRYRTAPIVVGDQRVAALRIGGRFRTDETAAFVAALEHALPVRRIAADDGSILLLYRTATT